MYGGPRVPRASLEVNPCSPPLHALDPHLAEAQLLSAGISSFPQASCLLSLRSCNPAHTQPLHQVLAHDQPGHTLQLPSAPPRRREHARRAQPPPRPTAEEFPAFLQDPSCNLLPINPGYHQQHPVPPTACVHHHHKARGPSLLDLDPSYLLSHPRGRGSTLGP